MWDFMWRKGSVKMWMWFLLWEFWDMISEWGVLEFLCWNSYFPPILSLYMFSGDIILTKDIIWCLDWQVTILLANSMSNSCTVPTILLDNSMSWLLIMFWLVGTRNYVLIVKLGFWKFEWSVFQESICTYIHVFVTVIYVTLIIYTSFGWLITSIV